MAKKIKELVKELVYEGYMQVYKYDLDIPSLGSTNTLIPLKEREIMHSSDSILVLIYAPLIDSFVLCKQFRAGVFFNTSHDEPFILECVSGVIDERNNSKNTAYKEVREEAGLQVEGMKLIANVYKSPGLSTEKTDIYYAEFMGTPKEGLHGLEDESEEILVHVVSREKVYVLMDTMKII